MSHLSGLGATYLEFERIRDLDSHDDTSLARMETARRRCDHTQVCIASQGGLCTFQQFVSSNPNS